MMINGPDLGLSFIFVEENIKVNKRENIFTI